MNTPPPKKTKFSFKRESPNTSPVGTLRELGVVGGHLPWQTKEPWLLSMYSPSPLFSPHSSACFLPFPLSSPYFLLSWLHVSHSHLSVPSFSSPLLPSLYVCTLHHHWHPYRWELILHALKKKIVSKRFIRHRKSRAGDSLCCVCALGSFLFLL